MLNPPNRRIRTRTYGGVGGEEPRGSPLSRFTGIYRPLKSAAEIGGVAASHLLLPRISSDQAGKPPDRRGISPPATPSTGASASRSWTLAGVTWHSIGKPSVSTAICRLRPLIFLPASKPRGPPASVVLTDWLSTTTAVGAAWRPSSSRAAITSTPMIWVHNPLLRQA